MGRPKPSEFQRWYPVSQPLEMGRGWNGVGCRGWYRIGWGVVGWGRVGWGGLE